MSALSDGRRAEIAARLAKATKGPWRDEITSIDQLTDGGNGYPLDRYPDSKTVVEMVGDGDCNHRIAWRDEDRDFIAHAPEDIRDLLLDGAAVRAELDEAVRGRDYALLCEETERGEADYWKKACGGQGDIARAAETRRHAAERSLAAAHAALREADVLVSRLHDVFYSNAFDLTAEVSRDCANTLIWDLHGKLRALSTPEGL